MSEEKLFIEGLIFKAPHANAPDFVKGSLSIKVAEFAAFAQQHQREGWLNISLKESRNGKYYAELDTWKPTQGESAKAGISQARAAADAPAASFSDDDIPF